VVSLEERTKIERGGKRKKAVKYLAFRRSTGGETELLLTSLLSAARPRIEDGLKAKKVALPVAGPARPAPPAAVTSASPKISAARPPSSDAARTDNITALEPSNSLPARNAATDAPNVSPEQAIGDHMTLEVGMPVEAHWGSKWWPAQIVQLIPDGKVKIHYDGWSDSNDEVLPRTRLRLAKAGTPSSKHPLSVSGTARNESSGKVTTATVLKKGQRLETQWGSKWWDAHVIDVLPDGSVKVHYEGWSDNFDETVPRDRLRLNDSNK
jgi:hypothetical protein